MFPGKFRLILAAGIVLVAVILVLAVRPPRARHQLPASPGSGRHAAWFEARRKEWETYEYVDLADTRALEAVVATWVRNRSGGIPIDEQLLTHEVVHFLQSLALRDADEYLRTVAGRRELRTDIAHDTFVQACYHEMSGRTLPSTADAREVLREFRRGHPDAVALPVAVSKQAYLEVARSKSWAACPAPRRAADPYVAVCPVYSAFTSEEMLARWNAPTVTAAIPLTRAVPSLERVLTTHDTTLTAIFGCVAKTLDGRRGILRVDIYYCPDGRIWQVETVTLGFGQPLHWAI